MSDHDFRLYRIGFVFVIFSCLCMYQISHNYKHALALYPQLHAPNDTIDTTSSYFSTNNITINTNYEIVTTNYGWKSSNPNEYSQRMISQEFFNAVTSHAKYNSTANWDELNLNPNPNRRLVIFMDVDTCIENNYPVYGVTWSENMARNVSDENWNTVLDKSCVKLKKAAESPALKANPHSRLVILDCGNGPWYRLLDVCGAQSSSKINGGGWGDLLNNTQVILAYYGARTHEARSWDIGLPPPAVKAVTLSPHELLWLETCKPNRRYYLYSFQGRGGFRRDRLQNLDNGGDIYVKIRKESTYWGKSGDLYDYSEVMRNSMFAGAPKGDCLYSYRFAEAMSAATIPVV